MTPVVQPQFSEDLLAILKESFEGPAPTVNDAQWNDLRQELRTAYRAVVEHLRGRNKWSADEFGLTMAIVAHTAYHLGPIRQLLLAAQ
jgi:hypothetical protein